MLGPVFAAREYRRLRRYRPFFLIMAAGEMLADKAPGISDRIMVGPRVARALSGAAVAVASRPRSARGVGGVVLAAALGAVAANLGTVVTFHLRRVANRLLGPGTVANVVTGALEDGLVVACGRSLAG
jgi:hypothetical protein